MQHETPLEQQMSIEETFVNHGPIALMKSKEPTSEDPSGHALLHGPR